jgi:hypothetical protein
MFSALQIREEARNTEKQAIEINNIVKQIIIDNIVLKKHIRQVNKQNEDQIIEHVRETQQSITDLAPETYGHSIAHSATRQMVYSLEALQRNVAKALTETRYVLNETIRHNQLIKIIDNIEELRIIEQNGEHTEKDETEQ